MAFRYFGGWLTALVLLAGVPVEEVLAASSMTGRIVSSSGNRGISGVSVMLLDKDGVVMDVVETGKNGDYRLDLGVLDSVTPATVKALYLQIESKSGRKSKAKVADVINSFSDIVTIKNIISP